MDTAYAHNHFCSQKLEVNTTTRYNKLKTMIYMINDEH